MRKSKIVFLSVFIGIIFVGTFYWILRSGYFLYTRQIIASANHPEWSQLHQITVSMTALWDRLHQSENSVRASIPGGNAIRSALQTSLISASMLSGKSVIFSSPLKDSVIQDQDGFLYYMGYNDHSEKTEIKLLFSLKDAAEKHHEKMWQILIPTKQLNLHATYPDGLCCYQDIKFEKVMQATSFLNKNRIDGAQILSRKGLPREKLFYKTDTHWTPLAALIMASEFAHRAFPDDPEFQKRANAITPENCHTEQALIRLQPLGEGLGKAFVPREKSVMYIPNYDFPVHYQKWEGRFTSKSVDKDGLFSNTLIQEEPKHFNYARYMTGQNYCMQIIDNLSIQNGHKLLIIQDSFGIPVSTFLAYLFQQIIILDPRYYTLDSLMKKIEELDFDVMLYCRSRNTIGVIDYW